MSHVPGRAVAAMAKRSAKDAGWFNRTRDMPETWILFGACVGVFGLGCYAIKRVLLNNTAGAYWDVNMRGNPELQSEEGRGGWEDKNRGKHSLFWHVAQYKTDEDGANIGILWDNRTRPHQYSKPGTAGVGSGVSLQGL